MHRLSKNVYRRHPPFEPTLHTQTQTKVPLRGAAFFVVLFEDSIADSSSREWRVDQCLRVGSQMFLWLLLALLALGVCWVVYKLTRVPPGKIPPIVDGPPLIGNAVRFGMDPINLIMDSRAKHGDVFTLKVFHEHMIFFVGNEAHEFFFKTPEDVFNAAAA